MDKLKKLLEEKRVVIADGAWGTQMHQLGLKHECPEMWNITHPEKIKQLARSYVDAGSEIILTNTFGGNFFKLKKYKLEKEIVEINSKGVEISREASGGKALVFASMGPAGEFLEPVGDTSEKDMIENFKPQVKGFVQGKADGVVIETMSDVKEAVCALKAVRELSGMSVIVSMTFAKDSKGFSTIMGTSPDKFAKAMEKEKVDAMGANCGLSIEDFVGIVRIMKGVADIPLWVKPNAGLPQVKNGKTFYPASPEYMAGYVKDLIEAGTRIIGGCCGTTPKHIKNMIEQRDKILHKQFP